MLITPQGKIFEEEIESLIVPGTLGQAGILAHHAPMVMSLKAGFLILKGPKGPKQFKIGEGILEVNPQHEGLVLVDSASAVP